MSEENEKVEEKVEEKEDEKTGSDPLKELGDMVGATIGELKELVGGLVGRVDGLEAKANARPVDSPRPKPKPKVSEPKTEDVGETAPAKKTHGRSSWLFG